MIFMMNIFHLLWIVPLAILIGFVMMAILCEREREVYERIFFDDIEWDERTDIYES